MIWDFFIFYSVCPAGSVCRQMAADWTWRKLHYIKVLLRKQLTVVKNSSFADSPQANEAADGQANRHTK